MNKNIIKINFIASKSSGEVSGIVTLPEKPNIFLVLAHGAGADMNHSFMKTISDYLADEGIAVLRYNFPYTENKRKRPDFTPVLIETVRSAVNAAKQFSKDIPLIAGGKSMGGRMTSTAASKKPLEGVSGIVFFGFPLHPAGSPSVERSEHLFEVKIRMLFLQGSRDKLAELNLLTPVIKKLGDKASLQIIDGADHSFHMLKSAGVGNDEIIRTLAKKVKAWTSLLNT
ncbi:MAG TPA: alpha/beta family hydrolase [Ignavibacteriaceae bacterium]|nr:alpha/beta family hydrolase [Ignavibacteriaceae bacterium]